jgi:hypothetical protein
MRISCSYWAVIMQDQGASGTCAITSLPGSFDVSVVNGTGGLAIEIGGHNSGSYGAPHLLVTDSFSSYQ